MITYIIFSYVFMAVYCLCASIMEPDDAKFFFKAWLLSPASLPYVVAVKFINW